jgi:hypothetical protein
LEISTVFRHDPINEKNRNTGWPLGLVGSLALALNWGFFGYQSLRNDPGSTKLWRPVAANPLLAFGLLAAIGAISSLLAARTSKRAWLWIALLNAVTFAMEFVSS